MPKASVTLVAAHDRYPACVALDSDGWYRFLRDAPEAVWHSLVAELVKATVAVQEDQRRIGRRPKPTSGSIEDVRRVLEVRYSELPFRDALAELVNGRSIRAFAGKVPVHPVHLARLLSGERSPSLATMAALARAGRVQPEFFLEYRIGVVQQAMADAMRARPALSISGYRRVAAALSG
jgi:hypothetical protein